MRLIEGRKRGLQLERDAIVQPAAPVSSIVTDSSDDPAGLSIASARHCQRATYLSAHCVNWRSAYHSARRAKS